MAARFRTLWGFGSAGITVWQYFHVNTLFTYAALCGKLRQCYNKTSKKPLPKEEKT